MRSRQGTAPLAVARQLERVHAVDARQRHRLLGQQGGRVGETEARGLLVPIDLVANQVAIFSDAHALHHAIGFDHKVVEEPGMGRGVPVLVQHRQRAELADGVHHLDLERYAAVAQPLHEFTALGQAGEQGAVGKPEHSHDPVGGRALLDETLVRVVGPAAWKHVGHADDRRVRRAEVDRFIEFEIAPHQHERLVGVGQGGDRLGDAAVGAGAARIQHLHRRGWRERGEEAAGDVGVVVQDDNERGVRKRVERVVEQRLAVDRDQAFRLVPGVVFQAGSLAARLDDDLSNHETSVRWPKRGHHCVVRTPLPRFAGEVAERSETGEGGARGTTLTLVASRLDLSRNRGRGGPGGG